MGRHLEGQTALVTGASRGIGRDIAVELAERGVRCAISGRDNAGLAETVLRASTRGCEPISLPADLSRPGGANELAEMALAELGNVDLLVNNAGILLSGLQAEVGDHDGARTMFETNFWAPMTLTRALVPQMSKRAHGTVVNVTSIGSVASIPLLGHYEASKAALETATAALRIELRNTGVRTLLVVPGLVRTRMLEHGRRIEGSERVIQLTPKGTPKRLARRVVRAIERGRSKVIYPRILLPAYVIRPFGERYARAASPRQVEGPRPIMLGSETLDRQLAEHERVGQL